MPSEIPRLCQMLGQYIIVGIKPLQESKIYKFIKKIFNQVMYFGLYT